MSEAPVTPAAQPAVAPSKPQTAIQLIEAEIANYNKQYDLVKKQAEQAIANTHAIEGAIQSAQNILMKLKMAEAQAVAEAKKLADEAAAAAKAAVHEVKEVTSAVVAEAESKVVSIESAAKKAL